MIPASIPVFTGVVVSNDALPRAGQVGATQGHPTDTDGAAIADQMNVKFDSDGVTEAFALSDLKRL